MPDDDVAAEVAAIYARLYANGGTSRDREFLRLASRERQGAANNPASSPADHGAAAEQAKAFRDMYLIARRFAAHVAGRPAPRYRRSVRQKPRPVARYWRQRVRTAQPRTKRPRSARSAHGQERAPPPEPEPPAPAFAWPLFTEPGDIVHGPPPLAPIDPISRYLTKSPIGALLTPAAVYEIALIACAWPLDELAADAIDCRLEEAALAAGRHPENNGGDLWLPGWEIPTLAPMARNTWRLWRILEVVDLDTALALPTRGSA
jgi:hypothetical protein